MLYDAVFINTAVKSRKKNTKVFSIILPRLFVLKKSKPRPWISNAREKEIFKIVKYLAGNVKLNPQYQSDTEKKNKKGKKEK